MKTTKHLRLMMEANERHRREIDTERARALTIKEHADQTALELARAHQAYRDEKANELRSQIERERGTYTTQAELKSAIEKLDATVKPINDYVTSQQGSPRAITTPMLFAALIAFGTVVAAIGTAVAIYFALRGP